MYYLIAFYQRIVELWCHAKNFPNAPRMAGLLEGLGKYYDQLSCRMWQVYGGGGLGEYDQLSWRVWQVSLRVFGKFTTKLTHLAGLLGAGIWQAKLTRVTSLLGGFGGNIMTN